MAIGIGWDFVRINCFVTHSTNVFLNTPAVSGPVQPKVEREHYSGSVQTENIYCITAEIHNR